jgi:hypothetical protein
MLRTPPRPVAPRVPITLNKQATSVSSDTTILIQPRISLPVRDARLTNVDTQTKLNTVSMPVLSFRSRLSLLMALASVALLTLAAVSAFCLLTPLPAIIKFVCLIVCILVGCSVASALLLQHYQSRLSEEPGLNTQRLARIDTLAVMASRVLMDTTGYLKAVRLPL